MIFGLPWWAIIPIVAIVGGMILRYREQELKYELKARTSSQEVQELRKMIHNLKGRIENLEAIATEEATTKKDAQMGDIEIKDDYYPSEEGNTEKKNKIRN